MDGMDIAVAVKEMDRFKKNQLFINAGERYYFSTNGQKGKNYGAGLYGLYTGLRALKTENPGLLEEHVRGGFFFFIWHQVEAASLPADSPVYRELLAICTADKSIPAEDDFLRRYEMFVSFMDGAAAGLIYTHDEAMAIIREAIEKVDYPDKETVVMKT